MINKKIETLDNGLKIICVSDDSKHYTHAEICVNFGSSFNDFIVEGKEYHFEAGLQHLLEHLLLEHGPYGDIATYFDKNFVNNNGGTSSSTTSFFIHSHENFEEYFTKLFKTINNATFTKEDVDVVKPPIYEEVRKCKDDPGRKLFLKRSEAIFTCKQHLLGTGEIEDVENFTYEDLLLIYNAFYKPNNEIIYIDGNFDIENTIKLIKKLCNEIDREFLDSVVIPFDEKEKVNKKEIVYQDEKNHELVEVLYKFSLKDYKGYEKMKFLDYLDMYFSNASSKKGELYKSLIEEGLTHYSIANGSLMSMDKDYVCFFLDVIGSDKEKIVKKIDDYISNHNYPTERNYKLREKNIIVNFAIKISEASGILSSIKSNGRLYDIYEEDTIDYIKSCSLDELKEYLDKIDFKNSTILIRKN